MAKINTNFAHPLVTQPPVLVILPIAPLLSFLMYALFLLFSHVFSSCL